MPTMNFEGTVPHLFPALGPSLMISMGYIDIGKWVAAVEGGACFGFDLVSLVLFFNCTAILCQYIATGVGMVAGKNLAEICREEYCRSVCILLGVQAEISLITSELTMVLGVAHGFSLLFGANLLTCIFLATVASVLLPFLVILWGNVKAEALYIGTAAIVLVFYVLGVLISQPEIPFALTFPKLSGESSYSLMALLGANIMSHNFYIQSSIVKQQRRQQNVAIGALFHDHFFAILFIFTGIFLVNYVLINSAATVFGTADELNFQDVTLLMEQIFRSPVAPVAFCSVLFFSSQISFLTWNIGGQLILRYFFDINLSVWVHHVIVKSLAIVPALYYTSYRGAEGIYQLLIFCQIILAMLLPSSVIPLFRVASSKHIMGPFKISWYLEIVALLAFLGMLASNIIFIIEILFGESNWLSNFSGTIGSMFAPYIVLLLVGCTSIGLTLYLAVTPLKSSSDGPGIQILTAKFQHGTMLSESREDDDPDKLEYDDKDSTPVPILENSTKAQYNRSILDVNVNESENTVDCDHHLHQSADAFHLTSTSPAYHPEMLKSVGDLESVEILDKVSVSGLSDECSIEKIACHDPVEKDVEISKKDAVKKNNEEGASLDPEEVPRGILPTPTLEDPGFPNTPRGKALDGVNGSGSITKLSGLGRAARRQLTAILDEFWGHLFDFHGKLTQEANVRKLDVLLGLDLKVVGSSAKADTTGDELSRNYFPDAERGFLPNSRGYSSPQQTRNSNMELSFGSQMASQSWSQNMLNTQLQSSSGNLLDPIEQNYLYPPQYADNRDYQPATIHGYQIASYLRGIGAGRSPYSSSISLDPPPTKSTASFILNSGDPVLYNRVQNELGSLGTAGFQNPVASRIGKLQTERPYYEPSLLGTSEDVLSSAFTKKYHTSPDISGIIASIRNSSLDDRSAQCVGPIGSRSYLGRAGYEQLQYLNPASRAGTSSAFDEFSRSKLRGDVFSSPSTLNPDAKSLWSRQPFEQLFGMVGKEQGGVDRRVPKGPSIAPKETFSYTESETKLLQHLRFCVMKLLKLEGSDWLFRQNGGFDEDLIDWMAATESYLHERDASEMNQACMADLQRLSERKNVAVQTSGDADPACYLSLSNCGESCIWQASLVVSFGVWCIRRILELSIVESRPELWGKYTYVLNRLQGILDPAFSKPRQPLAPCSCLRIPSNDMRSSNSSLQNVLLGFSQNMGEGCFTNASSVVELIKDVEAAVSGRKGRSGTAAGDVAFPKGKENLASVLKRYKRRLANKSPANHEGSLSRKVPISASSLIS